MAIPYRCIAVFQSALVEELRYRTVKAYKFDLGKRRKRMCPDSIQKMLAPVKTMQLAKHSLVKRYTEGVAH
jgi:hypothetical protein